jgi:hypothetical protein
MIFLKNELERFGLYGLVHEGEFYSVLIYLRLLLTRGNFNVSLRILYAV